MRIELIYYLKKMSNPYYVNKKSCRTTKDQEDMEVEATEEVVVTE